MSTSQTQLQSQVIELSANAFNAFCKDISGMFAVDLGCEQQELCVETISGLKQRFEKLVAVNSVKAEGTLDGNFQLIFNQEGLFALSGIITMMSEQDILKNIKEGSPKTAKAKNNELAEMGNLLVGSWDRVFREALDGHHQFTQTGTFIGVPWDDAEKEIGIASDEEFDFISYKITVGSYLAFDCGVIFPKTILAKGEAKEEIKAEAEAEEKVVAEGKEENTTEAEAEKKVVAENKEETSTEADKKAEPEEEQKATSEEESTKEPEENADSAGGEISETIQRMAKSSANLPGEQSLKFLTTSAKDIMQNEVLWGKPDDTVQQTLAKMQQADVGYMIVGQDGTVDGIVSKSDIEGALSVYLRPTFAKWRRPIDDATLQIKIKWIMSKPAQTIKPDILTMETIEIMCRSAKKCLPVVDQQGKVQGIVTMFDILKAMMQSNPNVSAASETPQSPSSS